MQYSHIAYVEKKHKILSVLYLIQWNCGHINLFTYVCQEGTFQLICCMDILLQLNHTFLLMKLMRPMKRSSAFLLRDRVVARWWRDVSM